MGSLGPFPCITGTLNCTDKAGRAIRTVSIQFATGMIPKLGLMFTRRNIEPDWDLGSTWITGTMVTKVQTGSITGRDSFETGPARVENRVEVYTTHVCWHSFRRVFI